MLNKCFQDVYKQMYKQPPFLCWLNETAGIQRHWTEIPLIIKIISHW